MRIPKTLTLLFFCLFAVPLLQGQTATEDEIKFASQQYIPQDPHAIRVQSTLVDMTVVVRDANGRPVGGLKKEDFQLFDNGKQQPISYFAIEYAHPPAVPAPQTTAETPVAPPPPVPPRYIGFYFDDMNMSEPDMLYARKAALAFVRNNMDETDRAGVFTSSRTVTQQFTSNKQQLIDAVAKLLSHKKDATIRDCMNITPYQAFEIAQFRGEHSQAFDLAYAAAIACSECDPKDAPGCTLTVETEAEIILSLSENFAQDSLGTLGDIIRYMEKMPGRRTLIMASSGFFSESLKIQHDVDKMIDAAIRAKIIVNTLDAKGLYAPNDMSDSVPVVLTGSLGAYADSLRIFERDVSGDSMSALADGTGGKFFHNSNDLDGGLRELAALPEVSYVLGFSPEDVKDTGAFRTLKVRVPNQHDITVNTRPGYFLPTKAEMVPATKLQKLNKEVMASDTLTEMAAHVSTESGRLATGEAALRVIAHVDGHGLYFKKIDKRHKERVIFITALFDMQGHYLAGIEGVMDLNLKDATHAQIARDGVNAKATLQAPPGTYRLREVMQEVVGGRIAASSQTVEIR
jgi:VWFA-related protein